MAENIHETIKKQIKEDEGLRLKPYRCTAGKLTIGYGRNLDDNGITEAEAEILLDHDLTVAAKEVITTLPWTAKLTPSRIAVLVNMSFNLGIERLMKFKNFLNALENDDYETAAAEMINSKWYSQTGIRAKRLVKQMKTGRFIERSEVG